MAQTPDHFTQVIPGILDLMIGAVAVALYPENFNVPKLPKNLE